MPPDDVLMPDQPTSLFLSLAHHFLELLPKFAFASQPLGALLGQLSLRVVQLTGHVSRGQAPHELASQDADQQRTNRHCGNPSNAHHCLQPAY
jgi:hypothetical protein